MAFIYGFDCIFKIFFLINFRALGRDGDNRKTKVKVTTTTTEYPQSILKQKWFEFVRYVENYKLQIFWLTLYSLVTVGVFIERSHCKHSHYQNTAKVGVKHKLINQSIKISINLPTIVFLFCNIST